MYTGVYVGIHVSKMIILLRVEDCLSSLNFIKVTNGTKLEYFIEVLFATPND